MAAACAGWQQMKLAILPSDEATEKKAPGGTRHLFETTSVTIYVSESEA